MTRYIKNLILAMAWAVALAVAGTSGTQGAPLPYDPENPPEPSPVYRLTELSDPEGLVPVRTSHYAAGQWVTVRATAVTDYTATGWLRDGVEVSSDRSYTFIMPSEDVTLTARYEYTPGTGDYNPDNPPEPGTSLPTHKVTITPVPEGLYSPVVQSYEEESTVSLTAPSVSGYQVAAWYRDGETVSTERGYSFVMPDTPVALSVEYIYNPGNPEEPGETDGALKTTIRGGTVAGNGLERVVFPFYLYNTVYLSSLKFVAAFDPRLTVDTASATLSTTRGGVTLSCSDLGGGRYEFEAVCSNNNLIVSDDELFTVPVTLPNGLPEGTVLPVTIESAAQVTSAGNTYSVHTNDGAVVCSGSLLASSIEITGGDRSVIVGSTVQLSAMVLPETVASQTIAWSSSDPAIATVSASGLVTGAAVGTATITAATTDGSSLSHSITVTVTPATPGSVVIDPSQSRLLYEEELTIHARVEPATATQEVEWELIDGESVEIVDFDATSITLRGILLGTSTIRATASYDGTVTTADAGVTVYGSIALPDETAEMLTRRTLELTAVTLPEDVERIDWKSLNPDIVTVGTAENAAITTDGNTVTLYAGGATGTARIVAWREDDLLTSDTCTVVVSPLPAESVAITGGDRSVIVGTTVQLEAVVTPEDAFNTRVAWSSSDPAIATVDETGLVTALVPGTATITAASEDNPGLSDGITLTVLDDMSTEVAIMLDGSRVDGSETRLAHMGSFVLTASVTPGYVEQSVVWSLPEGETVAQLSDATATSVTVTGLHTGRVVVRAAASDGGASAETSIEIYPVFKASAATVQYDGRMLTATSEEEGARLMYDFGDGMFAPGEAETLLRENITLVRVYCDVADKIESDTLDIEIPCFYPGGSDMWLHREGAMEKALEWCGGEPESTSLRIAGNMGEADFAVLRSLKGLRTADLRDVATQAAVRFDGMEGLRAVTLPSGAAPGYSFTGCTDLGAIVWTGSSAPGDRVTTGIANPDLLFYAPDASMVPAGLHNVIVGTEGNYRASSITLGGNPFYAPEAFTAAEISYTRRFAQTTGVGETRGWESITLPFTVERFRHPVNGACAPFESDRSGGEKPFWLYALGEGEPQASATLEAYRPYLISMPNNDRYYYDDETLGGVITFLASEAAVDATDDALEELGEDTRWIPAFTRVEAAEGISVINVATPVDGYPEGSVWAENLLGAGPFEVYGTNPQARLTPIFGDASIEGVAAPSEACVRADGSMIRVESGRQSRCMIFDISGNLLESLMLEAGECRAAGPFVAGFYIVRIGDSAFKIRL